MSEDKHFGELNYTKEPVDFFNTDKNEFVNDRLKIYLDKDCDILSLNPEDQDFLATEFSEGSNELKKLLLALWQSGIATSQGCSGIHGIYDHDSLATPYVTFNVRNIKMENYRPLNRLLLEHTRAENSNTDYDGFSKIKYKRDKREPISMEVADAFFAQINKIVERTKPVEKEREL